MLLSENSSGKINLRAELEKDWKKKKMKLQKLAFSVQ